MKTISGNSNYFNKRVLGIITKTPKILRNKYIYLTGSQKAELVWGYKGIISAISKSAKKANIVVSDPFELERLNENDIVTLDSKGNITVVWDSIAIDNSLMMTEECNCNCVMCPQPPRKDEDDLFDFNKRILHLLEPDKVENICLTGGEPTLPSGMRVIRDFMDVCREFDVLVDNFYIVTNAKKWRPELPKLLYDLYHFCDCNDISCLDISTDQFHDPI